MTAINIVAIIRSEALDTFLASTAGPLGLGSRALEFRQSDDLRIAASANQLLGQRAATKMLD